MKVALFNCLARSVPPKKSGGIEKVIYYLVEGLTRRGHQVTLFSTADSMQTSSCELVSVTESGFEDSTLPEETWSKLNEVYTKKLGKILLKRQHEFDIIHNHCLEAGLPILAKIETPHISTIHESVSPPSTQKRLIKYQNCNFVSISKSQQRLFPNLNYVKNIYHGIDTLGYPKVRKHQGYLLFTGRISEHKSPHFAIEAAVATGHKLVILGKLKQNAQDLGYYHQFVKPLLDAHKDLVTWIGEGDEKQVLEVASKAKACLLPVQFDEPFGLAAIEAMAVGCPVIAFDKGAYKETIKDGQTGFIVKDVYEMIKKIKEIEKIDRNKCAMHVREHFSADKMVEDYIKLYEEMTKKSSLSIHSPKKHRIGFGKFQFSY